MSRICILYCRVDTDTVERREAKISTIMEYELAIAWETLEQSSIFTY